MHFLYNDPHFSSFQGNRSHFANKCESGVPDGDKPPYWLRLLVLLLNLINYYGQQLFFCPSHVLLDFLHNLWGNAVQCAADAGVGVEGDLLFVSLAFLQLWGSSGWRGWCQKGGLFGVTWQQLGVDEGEERFLMRAEILGKRCVIKKQNNGLEWEKGGGSGWVRWVEVNNIMRAQPSDRESRRFSIFKQQLFQTATPFSRIPLHFHRPSSPTLILDHSQPHPPRNSSRRSRPRSNSTRKIFQGQRCFSTISHGREERNSNRSSIESGQRRRRHTIFKCESVLNTVQVREGSDCTPHDQLKDMITRPQSTRPQPQQEYEQLVLVKQSFTEVEVRRSNQAAVEQDRKRKKTEGEELRTIDSNIVHPLQFAKMMKQIRSSKNKRARVNYPIPRILNSPPCPQWEANAYMDHHGWVYHI